MVEPMKDGDAGAAEESGVSFELDCYPYTVKYERVGLKK